ncbi:hypothetical protein T484DRAFT_1758238 [Baffinella frigidus]|nr:hypothetical protein T484DRAFT_1758238 [Cryptophyta sp. CCMP2293]
MSGGFDDYDIDLSHLPTRDEEDTAMKKRLADRAKVLHNAVDERPVLPPVTPAEARAKAFAALKTATKAMGTTREAGLAAVKAAEEALATTREAALTADKAAEKVLETATAVIAAAAWSLEAAAASKRAKRE